jgi:hypothetical protein
MEEFLMDGHKIEVKTNCNNGSPITTVTVDGKEINGIHSIYFVHEAGASPMVFLELFADEVSIEGNSLIEASAIDRDPDGERDLDGPLKKIPKHPI